MAVDITMYLQLLGDYVYKVFSLLSGVFEIQP